MIRQRIPAQYGFTIVELLIVIVVIAILATISIVAYNGIQNRANDSAVQTDLKNIAKQFELYKVDNDVYPIGTSQIGPLKLKVSKNAYGSGFQSNAYNMLYCRVTLEGPSRFALMASSKSGTVFIYRSQTGSITTIAAWPSGSSVTNCNDISVGIPQVLSTDRDIFYAGSAWDAGYVSN